MKQQLPHSLLCTLSKNLTASNATWALLTLNEYLESKDPLRRAVVVKAKQTGASGALFDAACEGRTFNELREEKALKENRAILGTLSHGRRSIPSPRHRKSFTRTVREKRLAVNF